MGMFVGSNGGNDGFTPHSLVPESEDTAYGCTIAAVPVVHGRLVDKYSGEYNDFGHCSVCGALNLDGSKLCCQCGARMDGEEDQ